MIKHRLYGDLSHSSHPVLQADTIILHHLVQYFISAVSLALLKEPIKIELPTDKRYFAFDLSVDIQVRNVLSRQQK